MDAQRSVLIVDESSDSREVLRTVLEHRGLRILEASQRDEGLELARQHQPDLIVLDLELDGEAAPAAHEFAAQSPQATPLVVLGSARRRGASRVGEFISKPYHYAPLIRKIEQLLERQ